jgi:alpha-galactosidase
MVDNYWEWFDMSVERWIGRIPRRPVTASLTTLILAGFAGRMLAATNDFVEYQTGQVKCVEELIGSRWCGRLWRVGDETLSANPSCSVPVFQFVLQTRDEFGEILSTQLVDGWDLIQHQQVAHDHKRLTSVRLAHATWPVEVCVNTMVDGTQVLTRWLDIKNCGKRPVAVKNLAVWSGQLVRGDRNFRLGHSLRDDNGYEGWFGWTELEPGLNAFNQQKGLLYDDPYFVLGDDTHDTYFFGQLAWPVNYTLEFNVDNGVSFRFGPRTDFAFRVIGPGEQFTTPAVHLGLTSGGFDRAVQEMHTHVRRSVLPPRNRQQAYRIQCLMPEDRQSIYRGDAYNEANLKKTMEVAASAGAEFFIVDGPTWARGYGDWEAKGDWFPHGLARLRDFAHQHGMMFGLYAEPEGGRGDWSTTAAFRDHPDWFAGKILNLSIPAAAAYMEHEWRSILNRYELDLYRHDINVVGQGENTVTVRNGFQESDYFRHYKVLDDMVRRMQREYPNVLFQQASGGGTRLDLATLGAWDEHFSSDENSYPHVYRMAAGMSVYLPPEVIVTPNGMSGPHLAPDLATTLRGAYTLGNTPMIFNQVMPGNVDQFKSGELTFFRRYADLFREFVRPRLGSCLVYHHAPVNADGGVESGDWFAMEFCSQDHSTAWATVIRLSNQAGSKYVLYPRGLDDQQAYRVTLDNSGAVCTASGSELRKNGLSITLPPESDSTRIIPSRPESELILFEMVSKKE